MYRFNELVETANLTHADASGVVHEVCTENLYFRVKKMELTVYKAAQGEGGILQILDTNGVEIWALPVDSVYNKTFDFGKKGLLIGQNVGIQAILSGADTQASIWLCIIGHITVD